MKVVDRKNNHNLSKHTILALTALNATFERSVQNKHKKEFFFPADSELPEFITIGDHGLAS